MRIRFTRGHAESFRDSRRWARALRGPSARAPDRPMIGRKSFRNAADRGSPRSAEPSRAIAKRSRSRTAGLDFAGYMRLLRRKIKSPAGPDAGTGSQGRSFYARWRGGSGDDQDDSGGGDCSVGSGWRRVRPATAAAAANPAGRPVARGVRCRYPGSLPQYPARSRAARLHDGQHEQGVRGVPFRHGRDAKRGDRDTHGLRGRFSAILRRRAGASADAVPEAEPG